MTSTQDRAAQLAAVNELREYDHAFIGSEGVKHFADIFGLEITPRMVKASPNEPKGLTFTDGVAEAEGMDAAELAELICVRLGCNYGSFLYGRGAKLRVACNSIQTMLEV